MIQKSQPLKNIGRLRYSTNGNSWNILVSDINNNSELRTEDSELGPTFVVKDNIVTKEQTLTCASQMLSDYKSPFDATVVKLLKQNGYKMLGKSNLDEFGMGGSTTHSYYGPTINPRFEECEHIVGGSSGGSAAAVASGLADFALGTDTGGSVRLPASYCNVIGLKPTYGRISRWGVTSYAQTLDTVGIFSKDFELLRKVFNLLDAYDSKDPTSLPTDMRKKYQPLNKKKLQIGIPQEMILSDISPEVKQVWLDAIVRLQEKGHTIRTVSLPSIKKLLLAYYTLATAECASNLSRYDGIRYGYTTDSSPTTVPALISNNRSKSLGAEVKRRIILGNYTISSESGNHYFKATEVRQKLSREFNDIFNLSNLLHESEYNRSHNKIDVIVTPTSISGPPSLKDYLDQEKKDFLISYMNDILVVPASLAGLPAISIPFNGHGIQIIGQFGDDRLVMDSAEALVT